MGMVTLITVGTLKEDYLKEAVAEYQGALHRRRAALPHAV